MNDIQSSELLKRLLNSREEASKKWVPNLHCELKDKQVSQAKWQLGAGVREGVRGRESIRDREE